MTTPWSYDAIAEVYATDMGASMPFDDVGWYRALCQAHPGAVLELGCGTGRILNELLAAGIDAVGADRSLPMLQRLRRDAAARGLQPAVAQMDLRALALRARFRVILLPYSLITYLTDAEAAVALLAHLRDALEPRGLLVLDAFVPKPVASFSDYRLDYRREHGGGSLERAKRITAQADGTNRIERRYRLLDADGVLQQEFHTDETIRPYAAPQLLAMAAAAGFAAGTAVSDYADGTAAAEPRFFTQVLHPCTETQ